MAEISVSNLLCFNSLVLRIDPGVTFIRGPNSAGKSSAAAIIAALAAHNSNPLGLSAAAGKAYVRDGAHAGTASLDEEVRWEPPAGISAPTGAVPEAVAQAVGLIDFISAKRGAAERAKLWEGLFLPKDAARVLGPLWTRPPEQLQSVLDRIETEGWESAAKIYEGQRREAKRRWQQITGEQYGSGKAAKWLPDGWTSEIEGQSQENLSAAVTDANDHLRSLDTQRGATQADMARADDMESRLKEIEVQCKKDAGSLMAIDKKIKDQTKKLDAALSVREKAESATDGIAADAAAHAEKDPRGDSGHLTCPKCKAALRLEEAGLVTVKVPTAAQKAAWVKKQKALMKKFEAAKHDYEDAVKAFEQEKIEARNLENRHAECTAELSKGEAGINTLKAEIEKIRGMSEDPGTTEAERAQATERVREAERNLDAFMRLRGAQTEHENIVELDHIVSLLGPGGARASLMKKKIESINKILAGIHRVTEWLPIELSSDYSVLSNGRPVQLCAHNEKLKAQWAMQIACAMLTGSTWCVLDEADALDDESFTGLKALTDRLAAHEKLTDLKVVVCGTDLEVEEAITLTADHQAA